MGQVLDLFTQTLRQFDCGATFPLTAVVLKRNSDTIAKYLDQDVEFAVHGYVHIDYSPLAPEEQRAHLRHARDVFADEGITAVGFRSPYLSAGPHLYAAASAAGFSYVSNQPIIWDALEQDAFTPSTYASYEQALAFYDPWQVNKRPSVPRLRGQLVEIPVSLPDDEILLDRLDGEAKGLVEKAWRRILRQSYQRGELFTIQLHPERIAGCVEGLSAVLDEARTLTPPVWVARLNEIATWWRARADATVSVTERHNGGFDLRVDGPNGTAVLIRDVETDAPTTPWANGYQKVQSTAFTVHTSQRPFLGLSPATPPKLGRFLQQQGYVFEINEESHHYPCYLDETDFEAGHERALLDQIEEGDHPLVRLGRWPNGARSALAVTGDIDALTLWDYGLRVLGK
jgi:peptidoglycan/xylan/chitin deacetylase (PgdA/CDA1 family)